MTRKICVVTGSRAEYGLLKSVMQEIANDPELVLQVLVTGMHLSPVFGLTYKEIEADRFFIDRKVEMLSESDCPLDISKSIASGIRGCSQAFHELEPDIVVLLGDRFEIFSAAIAAHIALIPIAHLHGGELTEGSLDDAFRHSISKMSHLHFVAAEDYKKRLIQLGEEPRNVHLVGGLGADSIRKLKLLNKKELENELQVEFREKSLLVTFHPANLDKERPEYQFREVLNALSNLKDTTIIFTMPNADNGGREIIRMIEVFTREHINARAFISLGQLLYFSCILHVDGVLGNSSSGIMEVPSFKKGTINIGNRQLGRIQSRSIINCEPNEVAVQNAIKELYSPDFQTSLTGLINPYDNGEASTKIVKILKEVYLTGIVKKFFYNL